MLVAALSYSGWCLKLDVNDLSAGCQKQAWFLARFLSCPTPAAGSGKKVICGMKRSLKESQSLTPTLKTKRGKAALEQPSAACFLLVSQLCASLKIRAKTNGRRVS